MGDASVARSFCTPNAKTLVYVESPQAIFIIRCCLLKSYKIIEKTTVVFNLKFPQHKMSVTSA